MALKIISITSDLDHFGGAQKVLLDVHEGLKRKYDAQILGFQKFEDLHPKYQIQESEYIKFCNPFFLNDKLLIVHARNVMAFIVVIKRLFFLNTKILYVAHNVYSTHKNISFFPDNLISISKKVTDNLITYFKLKNRKITLIYNGIKDEGKKNSAPAFRKNNKITILYSGRVNDVKRQLQIVDNLKNKLHPDIEIHFAGTGPDYDELVEKCRDTTNFKSLGFVENVNELVIQADFLMLFSIQEGLPISLIEGAMHGKPLLVNDVGGNLEIGIPGVNGIELSDDWESLASTLNKLLTLSQEEYLQMSQNSRSRYEQMFTYENMITNYVEIIEAMQL